MLDSVFVHLTLELFLGFIGLLIAVKIIGKRQVQQVSPFDFVSAVVLGELLGNAIYNDETTVLHVFYAIFIWTLLLYTIEKIVQKSRKIRYVIEGSPKLVIKNGLIDYQVLKKEKLDFTELLSLLRSREAFSVREIEYAIIEPNGIITVIKKAQDDVVKKRDMNISFQPAVLTLPIIIDGEIDESNLEATGYDEDWLRNNLQQQDITRVKDVMYAEWNQNEGLYIQKVSSGSPSS